MNGIVERPDRQQARAELRLGQAQRGEQQEKVVLGDAQLDVAAVGRQRPFLRRGHAPLAKHVRMRGAVEHADLVDPAAEIGRDRHVGRGGDDALGEIAAGAGNLDHDPAEPLLRRRLRGARGASSFGIGSGGAAGVGRWAAGTAGQERVEPPPPRCRGPRICSHSSPSGMFCVALKLAICAGFISPAWLSLWPASGRPQALDRVGDEAVRRIVGRRRRRPRRSPPCRGRARLVIRAWSAASSCVAEQPRDAGIAAEIGLKPLPPRRRRPDR